MTRPDPLRAARSLDEAWGTWEQTHDFATAYEGFAVRAAFGRDRLVGARCTRAPRTSERGEDRTAPRCFRTLPLMRPRCRAPATGSADGAVWLFDTDASAMEPTAVLRTHSAPILDVEWSEDGSRMVSCDTAGRAMVWLHVPLAAPSP